MCRIDDCDERVQVFQEGKRRARKPHICGECGRPIAIGETYDYIFGSCDGYAQSYKTCSHCLVAREWLSKNCGGWVYEQVIEEIEEHGQEYPALAMPLYRIAVGARRKWQRFDGGMMPVPKMPPSIEATLTPK